jgi:hypothetical protein
MAGVFNDDNAVELSAPYETAACVGIHETRFEPFDCMDWAVWAT